MKSIPFFVLAVVLSPFSSHAGDVVQLDKTGIQKGVEMAVGDAYSVFGKNGFVLDTNKEMKITLVRNSYKYESYFVTFNLNHNRQNYKAYCYAAITHREYSSRSNEYDFALTGCELEDSQGTPTYKGVFNGSGRYSLIQMRLEVVATQLENNSFYGP